MKPLQNIHIGRSIMKIVTRFHMTLFVVLLVSGLSVAVLLINNILTDPTIGESYQSPISAGSINQAALERIDSLHRSDETLPDPLPTTTRTNPFSE